MDTITGAQYAALDPAEALRLRRAWGGTARATTPRGYPFPLRSWPPDAAVDIQALAEAVSTDVTSVAATLGALGQVQHILRGANDTVTGTASFLGATVGLASDPVGARYRLDLTAVMQVNNQIDWLYHLLTATGASVLNGPISTQEPPHRMNHTNAVTSLQSMWIVSKTAPVGTAVSVGITCRPQSATTQWTVQTNTDLTVTRIR